MKRFELIDRKTGEIHEIGVGLPAYNGDDELEFEFKKRMLVKNIVSFEYQEKGLAYINNEEERREIVPEHRTEFEIECVKREREFEIVGEK